MYMNVINIDLHTNLYIEGGSKISAIIVTDDYLCYKEPKSSSKCFLILNLTNYLSLKFRTNGNIERRGDLLWTGRKSSSCLRSQTDPLCFLYSVVATFKPEN